jgi:hypothetical protein
MNPRLVHCDIRSTVFHRILAQFSNWLYKVSTKTYWLPEFEKDLKIIDLAQARQLRGAESDREYERRRRNWLTGG